MEQSTWVKIGVVGGLSIILASATLGLKWQHDMLVKQAQLEQSVVEMRQLGDGVVRSQSQYITKEDLYLLAQGDEMQKALDDLKKLRADLLAVQQISTTTPGYTGTNLGSTTVVPRTDTPTGPVPVDPYGYWKNAQVLSLEEPLQAGQTKIPFGEVKFKAWQDKPWDVTVYPRTYKVTTVLGQDEDGRHYAYNKFTVETQGKEHPVEVTQAKMQETLPESKLRFSPRFYLGLGGGVAIDATGTGSPVPKGFVQPHLQVSFLSLGKTKVDPDWSFLGVGLGYEAPLNRGSLVISPVSYNVGHHLPLVNNLFIGPLLGVDTARNVTISAGVQVGL
jgi:hypothetical protein